MDEVGPPDRRPLSVELLPDAVPLAGPPLVPAPAPRTNYWGRAALLFALTFFTTTTLGGAWHFYTRTDVSTDLPPWITWRMIGAVWSDRAVLVPGLQFSLAALSILLAHELGHYFACRRYRLPATPPFFLPVPFTLGTFGAFIRIKAPLKDKRELFDVGSAGPFAGFVVLLPFLLLGLAWSSPASVSVATSDSGPVTWIYLPGSGLLWTLVSRAFHGPLPDDTILNLHPFALAAWLGLFATMLNLLPFGQLDGGHILYAAVGRVQHKLARPLWIALLLLSFYSLSFLVWSAITLIVGTRHPPVLDETTPLGRSRMWLAVAALLLFVVCFMPVPMRMEALAQ